MPEVPALESPRKKRAGKISYIVHQAPREVQQLIEEFGYEAPSRKQELVLGVKSLIRTHGRVAVKKLLKLHPDRGAIKAMELTSEDNYCNACSNFSYNPEAGGCGCGHSNYTGENKGQLLQELSRMKLPEMESYYRNLLGRSNRHPEDKLLAGELQIVWNHLIQKRETAPPGDKGSSKNIWQSAQIYWIGGLILVAGLVIGSSFKWTKFFTHAS